MTDPAMQDPSEFSDKVTAFLETQSTPRAEFERAVPLPEARRFQRLLFEAGLAGLTWPTDLGGQGFSPSFQRLFDEIAEGYEVPTSALTLALRVCAPAVVEFGSAHQRAGHAIPTLRGEHIWCQLWSEPEAGSDLASARTTAVATSAGWTIRGHKIWTSLAHVADFGLLLARTDPDVPGHRGLSMFIVPMNSPGLRCEPIEQSTGEAEFNEVWLDEVQLPADALLGELGRGWDVVTWMMGRERTSVGIALRSSKTLMLTHVLKIAALHGDSGDPFLRRDLVQLRRLQRAADALRLRTVQRIENGTATAALASATKILEARVLEEAADLAAQIMGTRSSAWDPNDPDGSEFADAQVKAPSFAIGGGTTEIQLNTLAEQVLGLPREPRPQI